MKKFYSKETPEALPPSFRRRLYWGLAFLLQGVGLALCLVSWISILYPLVLLAGGIVSVICLLLLLSFPYRKSQVDAKGAQIFGLGPKNPHWRFRVRAYATTRRIFRALLFSLFAMILSFGLMVVFKGSSWLFYIRPMEQELEPYRKLYQEGQKDFRQIRPDLNLGHLQKWWPSMMGKAHHASQDTDC